MLSHRVSILLLASVLLFAVGTIPVAAQQRSDYGTLSIQVRPPQAEIFIDGERWVGAEGTGPLLVQLSPGSHRVEIRSAGRQTFATDITIRAGVVLPLNVALTAATPAASASPSPASTPDQAGSGRIVQVTPSENGFVIAPDFRVTEVDHRTSGLVGAYGGYVFGGQFLVGGGAYWETRTATFGSRLIYGGPVLEWRMFTQRTIGFNLHGLVGAGQWRADAAFFRGGFDGHGRFDDRAFDIGFGRRHDTFFVAEPEAQVVIRFGRSIRVQGGAGYRATSNDGPSGASGSISIQFGR